MAPVSFGCLSSCKFSLKELSTIRYLGKIEYPLIKLQSDDIIKKMQGGSFYMNSLEVYRDRYKGNNVIGDPYEGKFFIHEATMVTDGKIEVIKDRAFPTANENDFVFCMFGKNPKNPDSSFSFTEEQKQKLLQSKEYDTALLITNVSEFIRRVEKAANAENYDIVGKFVHYYDEKVDDVWSLLNLATDGMENIVFHKRKIYSYQQEARFTIKNDTGKDHLELDIGDIGDISEKFTIEDIFRLRAFR